MNPSVFIKAEILFTEPEIKEILIREARNIFSSEHEIYFDGGECEKVKSGFNVKFEKLG